jgi:flagellar basal-body rod protein FlgC
MIELLSGISSSSAALNAERVRMEIISQNIANANTTRGVNGGPYERQQVVFESILSQAQQTNRSLDAQVRLPRVARVQTDSRPPQVVFNPGHPDADANGMVSMPNININEEMADMIASSRAFEANLAVIRNARAMALQTLGIGRRG